MYVITGITGQVGGAAAKALLAAGQQIRAVVRDAEKGAAWAKQGCEVALADMNDVASLVDAFANASAVFVLIPPCFDPKPGFPEARKIAAALREALLTAKPERVVMLSTIGAQATDENLLSQLGLIEEALSSLPLPVTFLRAVWFMENALWDIGAAVEHGIIQTYLQPVDKLYPMVATADVGRLAAELMTEQWRGKRVIEIVGPGEGVSPAMIAATLGLVLRRDVRAQPVPRDHWEELFRSQGMQYPLPRIRMLDGFNEGWIRFEHVPRYGTTPVDTVLQNLVRRTVINEHSSAAQMNLAEKGTKVL